MYSLSSRIILTCLVLNLEIVFAFVLSGKRRRSFDGVQPRNSVSTQYSFVHPETSIKSSSKKKLNFYLPDDVSYRKSNDDKDLYNLIHFEMNPLSYDTSELKSSNEVQACSFPFIYDGKTFYSCLQSSRDPLKKWCSLTSNYDRDTRWGYCSTEQASKRVLSSRVRNISPKTEYVYLITLPSLPNIVTKMDKTVTRHFLTDKSQFGPTLSADFPIKRDPEKKNTGHFATAHHPCSKIHKAIGENVEANLNLRNEYQGGDIKTYNDISEVGGINLQASNAPLRNSPKIFLKKSSRNKSQKCKKINKKDLNEMYEHIFKESSFPSTAERILQHKTFLARKRPNSMYHFARTQKEGQRNSSYLISDFSKNHRKSNKKEKMYNRKNVNIIIINNKSGDIDISDVEKTIAKSISDKMNETQDKNTDLKLIDGNETLKQNTQMVLSSSLYSTDISRKHKDQDRLGSGKNNYFRIKWLLPSNNAIPIHFTKEKSSVGIEGNRIEDDDSEYIDENIPISMNSEYLKESKGTVDLKPIVKMNDQKIELSENPLFPFQKKEYSNSVLLHFKNKSRQVNQKFRNSSKINIRFSNYQQNKDKSYKIERLNSNESTYHGNNNTYEKNRSLKYTPGKSCQSGVTIKCLAAKDIFMSRIVSLSDQHSKDNGGKSFDEEEKKKIEVKYDEPTNSKMLNNYMIDLINITNLTSKTDQRSKDFVDNMVKEVDKGREIVEEFNNPVQLIENMAIIRNESIVNGDEFGVKHIFYKKNNKGLDNGEIEINLRGKNMTKRKVGNMTFLENMYVADLLPAYERYKDESGRINDSLIRIKSKGDKSIITTIHSFSSDSSHKNNTDKKGEKDIATLKVDTNKYNEYRNIPSASLIGNVAGSKTTERKQNNITNYGLPVKVSKYEIDRNHVDVGLFVDSVDIGNIPEVNNLHNVLRKTMLNNETYTKIEPTPMKEESSIMKIINDITYTLDQSSITSKGKQDLEKCKDFEKCQKRGLSNKGNGTFFQIHVNGNESDIASNSSYSNASRNFLDLTMTRDNHKELQNRILTKRDHRKKATPSREIKKENVSFSDLLGTYADEDLLRQSQSESSLSYITDTSANSLLSRPNGKDFISSDVSPFERDRESSSLNSLRTTGLVNMSYAPEGLSVKTNGGNANGAKCNFPFIYNGETYFNCIALNRGKPWCSTQANYDSLPIWGYCIQRKLPGSIRDDDAREDKGISDQYYKSGVNVRLDFKSRYITTFGGNSEGRSCVIPFIYDGNMHRKCIPNDEGLSWCSTTRSYDVSPMWGYCCNSKKYKC